MLLTGETGTGKGVIARAIHAASPRREKPFVSVNCAAVPFELSESLFLGHERNAFPGATRSKGYFEQAEGGTIFLDEIGDLTLTIQVKLLKVIAEKIVQPLGAQKEINLDFRIVAATNVDLSKAVAAGRFREDLYARFRSKIHLPPLRERPGAIRMVGRWMYTHLRKELALTDLSEELPPATLAALESYAWPENVRGVENLLTEAMVMAKGPNLLPEDLFRTETPPSPSLPLPSLPCPVNDYLGRYEAAIIRQALDATTTHAEAARQLGLHPSTLTDRINALEKRKIPCRRSKPREE